MLSLPPNVEHTIVAPLNWGLGHATRCIPIINYLLDCGIKVTLASDGEALELLEEAFPQLKSYSLPSYNIKYDGKGEWALVFKNSFKFFSTIIKERKAIRKVVEIEKPDLIISDSRFGLTHTQVTSYIITHQLNLQSSSFLLRKIINVINQNLINGFEMCVIPDFEDHRLSGTLSQNDKIIKKVFIGPLSRLRKLKCDQKYFLSIILSGPEPSRSIFEAGILSQIADLDKPIVLIRGTNKQDFIEGKLSNLRIIKRANSKEINEIILSSKYVLSRSGYSSIMDYYALEKKAILVPSPNQTEQEYLSKYLNSKYGFVTLEEDDLSKLSFLLS